MSVCGGPTGAPDEGVGNKSGRKVFCVKFQKEMPGLDYAPWPGELGQRIYENVSAQAWKLWEDPKYEHLGEVHLNHPDLGVFVADCDAQGRPVFTSEELDRLIERTDADRVQLGHLTGRTWEIALEQLDEANKGIVIPSDTPPASAPLQAVALNQLAAGPSRWMPADAPGQARSTSAPDR